MSDAGMTDSGNWIEDKIRQAIARGDFDNLPGAGKPLHLSDVDDPDWWVKQLAKREGLDFSAAVPTVIALRRERDTFPDSLDDLATEESVRAVLSDYNRRVVEDRRRPALGRGLPIVARLVDVDDMVEQWRARRGEERPPVSS